MITVVAAPPFATIQDLGRTGYRDSGVPVSGVTDRTSALALNALLGNHASAAMIEWAVAGGVLGFNDAAIIAIGGADAQCTVNGDAVESFTPIDMRAGDELRVERIIRGRFLLVAVRGGIDVPRVLGSRSTLLSAAIGGFHGRRLRSGDRLPVGDAVIGAPDTSVARATPTFGDAMIHVMRGPQAALFDDRAWAAFLGCDLTVSRVSDRSGYRLEGATLTHSGSPSLPSEPACVGAIQVPDGGAPIVIMHDGPTVGGYPKIAVIRSSFISRFAQLAPGDKVRFTL
jgi:antagonist of KipI